ncbi:ribokinase [Edaphobacter sp. 12200R-103]|uniref:ribokinase n=1 Tax=Edaphobacter sp. 12200R-103 TaxID=2703788 RepID=UPI00192EE1F9|nr:ribokinase [Edaphobacter sp. 12200R-103]
MNQNNRIVVLGSFVADLAFHVETLPVWGETRMGSSFAVGPGGKGSNQAVAAARAGGNVCFVTKLGQDSFGEMARKLYREEGIDTGFIASTTHPTGAAAIILDEKRGENAIIIVPGACFEITTDEVDRAREVIASSSILVAQLELPVSVVEHGLRMARTSGVTTILNPAPALPLPESIYPLCDYLTPNESEAASMTGIIVDDLAGAERAADALLARGVRNVALTMGANGVFLKNRNLTAHVPAVDAGAVVETTGAGDAFNGGFAVALAEGKDFREAARFACAVAGISVTRRGTAPSMPQRDEVEALLASTPQG